MEPAHPHDSAYKYLFKNKRIFLQLLQSFVPEDFVQNLSVDVQGKGRAAGRNQGQVGGETHVDPIG